MRHSFFHGGILLWGQHLGQAALRLWDHSTDFRTGTGAPLPIFPSPWNGFGEVAERIGGQFHVGAVAVEFEDAIDGERFVHQRLGLATKEHREHKE